MSKAFEKFGLKFKSKQDGTTIFVEEIPENNAVRYLIFEDMGQFFVHKAIVSGENVRKVEVPLIISYELYKAIGVYVKKELKWE